MNQPQCHGPYRPTSVVRDSPVMCSPFVSASAFSSSSSYTAVGSRSSPQQTVDTSFAKQDPMQISPVSPLRQQLSSPQDVGSSRLKRRASQGSILTKPSPVSRFLSRSNASLHLSSLESKSSGRIESRTHSADSRLRLSTRSPASSSLATRASESASPWDSKGDYPATLPPTPPDDDEHVAWSPQSGMLLFEPSMNRHPGPVPMDEGPNMENAPRNPHSDGLNSPSDQLSNVSPSTSGGSPGSSGDMDCDDNSWLENATESTGEFGCPSSLTTNR